MLGLNHHLIPACAKENPTVTAERLKEEVLFNLCQTDSCMLAEMVCQHDARPDNGHDNQLSS